MVSKFLDNVAVAEFFSNLVIGLFEVNVEYLHVSANILGVLTDLFDVLFVDGQEENIIMSMVEEICLNETLGGFLTSRLFEALDGLCDSL